MGCPVCGEESASAGLLSSLATLHQAMLTPREAMGAAEGQSVQPGIESMSASVIAATETLPLATLEWGGEGRGGRRAFEA